MIKIEVSFAIITIFFLHIEYAIGQCTSVGPTSQEESQVIDKVQELGRKISYAQWNKNPPPSNVVLSPLSINIILNLLIAATDGQTSTEIKLFLGYASSLDECKVHKIFQNFFTSLYQQSEVEISLYTKLFPQEGIPILASYLTLSNTFYFAEVQNLDYTNPASGATNTINQWVFDSTKGKIEKLFDEDLTPDTVLVIVNVIFFNATWVNKFPTSGIENGTFETETGNITIPMMTSVMNVSYLSDNTLGLEIISLPYVGNRYSMYIIKPTVGPINDKLKEIESMIDANQLDNLINQMEITEVIVTIPRMKLDSDLDLKEDFQNFGINKIFTFGAEFTRMTNVPNLAVSKIKHKAIIEVTEDGTVAAAVTGAVIIKLSSLGPSTFTLNHPFLLFIRDNNGLIVFYARVMNPEPYW